MDREELLKLCDTIISFLDWAKEVKHWPDGNKGINDSLGAARKLKELLSPARGDGAQHEYLMEHHHQSETAMGLAIFHLKRGKPDEALRLLLRGRDAIEEADRKRKATPTPPSAEGEYGMLWDRFTAHLNATSGYDNKSFLGSRDRYRALFIEANRAAAPVSGTGRMVEALNDDVLCSLVYKSGFSEAQQKALLITRWQDGIDIDYPGFALKNFVRHICEALSPQPQEATPHEKEA